MKTVLRFLSIVLGVGLPAMLAGCSNSTAGLEASEADSITDASYLTDPLWNDGQAEVAFYRVRRSRNQYGEPEEQEFLVGTYLVKHDFDPAAQAKAEPEAGQAVSAFKYALFYEFESGSYEYKRSHVVNAGQRDLRPLKYSFTSFDWCSNLYKEQAFTPGERAAFLMRSDDYGNRTASFDYEARTYPPALMPLLVRGMDFETARRHEFGIVLEGGDVVGASAERAAIDTVETAAGVEEAERIVVRYDGDVPSPYAEEADQSETYWRATGEDRRLLVVEGASGRYRMELIEALRSPYWEEDVYERLDRVRARP